MIKLIKYLALLEYQSTEFRESFGEDARKFNDHVSITLGFLCAYIEFFFGMKMKSFSMENILNFPSGASVCVLLENVVMKNSLALIKIEFLDIRYCLT